MTLKSLITLTTMLSISAVLYAQEQYVNLKYADSVRNRNWDLGIELTAIIIYNDGVKSFGYTDTIKITKSENQFKYYYKDSLITDFSRRRSNVQRLIMLDFSPGDLTLISTTQQSLTNKFELYIGDAVNKLWNYSNDVQIGRYEERTKSGKVVMTGCYCQIDSMYSDTTLYFDPETYEDILEIIPRTKYPIKSGIWRYYSLEGILIKEEKHKGCT